MMYNGEHVIPQSATSRGDMICRKPLSLRASMFVASDVVQTTSQTTLVVVIVWSGSTDVKVQGVQGMMAK
jgi:hypothetical protein